MRLLLLIASCSAIWLFSRCLLPRSAASVHPKQLIISTDISGGVLGPLGGCQHCNPSLQYPDSSTPSALIAYRPQDTDDAMAVMMALNHPAINLQSIIPLFGNTDLASEMFIADYITRKLKGRKDIPIAPGALAPVIPVLLQPPALYFNETLQGGSERHDVTGQVLPNLDLFKLGCPNLGVLQMHQDLLSAMRRQSKAHIAVLGPASDVACLLTNHPEVKPGIEAIIFLGSQPADSPMTLNDGPAPPDFNVFMDPLAAAVMLYAAQGVKLVLMHWTLTSQGSTRGQNIVLNRDTIKPPPGERKPGQIPASTRWLWAVQDVRSAAGFGSSRRSNSGQSKFDQAGQTLTLTIDSEEPVPPGPFDQYVIQYVIDSSVFECKQLPVYMQQCPSAPWSLNNSSSSSSDKEPYNDADNPCPGHGPGSRLLNREQPAMMLVDLKDRHQGPLVNGNGLLPSFNDEAARRVTVCYDYAEAGRQQFVESLYRWIW